MTIEVKEFREFIEHEDRAQRAGQSELRSLNIEEFCKKWNKYKKYLELALSILPIPAAIKGIIEQLIKIADKFCSTQ